VLDGDLAGRRLESLSEAEAIDVLRTVAGDPQSVQLMEAFMERRFPGWHDRAGDSAESRGGPMSREEALEILGLKPGASEEEIRTAHRRLMKRNHPDQGGSTWFATQINTAKDVLLG
ncbi:MAG: DnaJ domain-containing protein, partial [Hyphomicrobiaceae bacterium]